MKCPFKHWATLQINHVASLSVVTTYFCLLSLCLSVSVCPSLSLLVATVPESQQSQQATDVILTPDTAMELFSLISGEHVPERAHRQDVTPSTSVATPRTSAVTPTTSVIIPTTSVVTPKSTSVVTPKSTSVVTPKSTSVDGKKKQKRQSEDIEDVDALRCKLLKLECRKIEEETLKIATEREKLALEKMKLNLEILKLQEELKPRGYSFSEVEL